MKRTLIALLLVLGAFAMACNTKDSPTGPSDKARMYLDVYVYYEAGINIGKGYQGARVTVRDDAQNFVYQCTTGADGYCPRKELFAELGPLNIYSQPAVIDTFMGTYSASGVLASWVSDPAHNHDKIYT